jgi:hypothetical protein
MAAETKKERQQLLSVGPFCMTEVDSVETVAYCSPNATRTQRSGVTDVEYMIRPDREYWLVCRSSNPHMHARANAPLTFPP